MSSSPPMHPQIQWAVQAGVLSWDEARSLSMLPAWATEDSVDESVAALMRRYLYWVSTADLTQ